MTRQFYRTKIDFIEQCLQSPLEKTVLVPGLQISQIYRWIKKVTSCKEGPGILGYLGDLKKRGIHLQILQVKSGGKFLAWLQEGLWKSNVEFFMKSSRKANFKKCIWSITIFCCIYVNNQAKFNEMRCSL